MFEFMVRVLVYGACSRLWCVYELAVYLKLRGKDANVEFVSISQRNVEVFVVVMLNSSYIIIGWMIYAQIDDSIEVRLCEFT